MSLGIAADVLGAALVPGVVAAGLVAAANGLSSAQLAAAHPVSGGTYEYGHRFVHPMAGFVAGWTFLSAKSASAATAALGCAGYLLHLLGYGGGPELRTAVAVGIALAVTALVAGGVRRSNAANAVLVSVTMLALTAFVLAASLASPSDLSAGLDAGRIAAGLTEAPGSFLRGTALLFVAYTGYGRIATLGEEVRAPERTIPRAIIATLIVSMLLYVSVSAAALAAVGAEAFARATLVGGAPLEIVLRSIGRPAVALAVGAGAVTAMAGVLLNLVLGLSRVLLAMARRREMPGALAYVHPGAHSPTRAVWAVGILTALLALTGDIGATWSFSAFSVLVYYGLTNLAALRLPRGSRRFPRWVAVAGLVSCAALAFLVEPAIWMTGLASIGLGLLLRALMRSAQTPA